ncbi:hypothetical protein BH23ACT10_BH23ACT10_31030 [soil metagenome]
MPMEGNPISDQAMGTHIMSASSSDSGRHAS